MTALYISHLVSVHIYPSPVIHPRFQPDSLNLAIEECSERRGVPPPVGQG